MKELQIHKGDLTQTRLVNAPDPAISEGEVLMEIEQFGFSSPSICSEGSCACTARTKISAGKTANQRKVLYVMG